MPKVTYTYKMAKPSLGFKGCHSFLSHQTIMAHHTASLGPATQSQHETNEFHLWNSSTPSCILDFKSENKCLVLSSRLSRQYWIPLQCTLLPYAIHSPQGPGTILKMYLVYKHYVEHAVFTYTVCASSCY